MGVTEKSATAAPNERTRPVPDSVGDAAFFRPVTDRGITDADDPPSRSLQRLREGGMLVLAMLGCYLMMALVGYHPQDTPWQSAGQTGSLSNPGGLAGALAAAALFHAFGKLAFVFPVLLIGGSWRLFCRCQGGDKSDPWLAVLRLLGGLLCLASSTALMELFAAGTAQAGDSGGLAGQWLVQQLLPLLNSQGAALVLVSFLLIGMTLCTRLSLFSLLETLAHGVSLLGRWIQNGLVALWRQCRRRTPEPAGVASVPIITPAASRPPPQVQVLAAPPPASEPVRKRPPGGKKPALTLLDAPAADSLKPSEQLLTSLSQRLEQKLADFGVEVAVCAALPGPVITRFEVQPAAGIKASRITGLASDLARSLAVVSVRVVEVIPGKTVIGIEIPNENRETVNFGQLMASPAFADSKSLLTMALGHDIAGQPVVADLARMPHLLVAGTTGSGKSVGVNAMILSLLYKASPDDVRLVMVDPKMLELSVYDGIPHLLTPVVTDMKEAACALRWCVEEMERRYRLMTALGVRNIHGCNDKIRSAERAGKPLPDPLWEADEAGDPSTPPDLQPLPFIVVIIDEFADMMMIVGKKVEELIARIAQKARAAGIHLILATQRPSVDVITGLIKANIPTRISFQVSSRIDSRTILDQGGAEQLLGQGDMIYLPPGTAVPVRVHGAFVSDDEVHRVVADWKARREPAYLEDILKETGSGSQGSDAAPEDAEQDSLYDEAVAFVIESRRPSISAVQRRFRIGYNRSANLVEAMEQAGIISPPGNNGTREVNVPPS